MTDEPEGSSSALPEAPERRTERQAPVGNVRDLRSRPADNPGAAAGDIEDEIIRDPNADEPTRPELGNDDEPGEDGRSPHRKGRKRRRRGRGEDSEGIGGGPAPERPNLDPEEVSKRAWKIYLGEVSEEGLALINDNTAREMAKRSFRLAEIFIEEQSRRA
jgi:hypothetical protein